MANTVIIQNGGITVTEHDKNEWSRMAKDAYSNGINYIGHRYSMAASIPRGTMLTCQSFDALQINYRAWLIDGIDQFREVDEDDSAADRAELASIQADGCL